MKIDEVLDTLTGEGIAELAADAAKRSKELDRERPGVARMVEARRAAAMARMQGLSHQAAAQGWRPDELTSAEGEAMAWRDWAAELDGGRGLRARAVALVLEGLDGEARARAERHLAARAPDAGALAGAERDLAAGELPPSPDRFSAERVKLAAERARGRIDGLRAGVKAFGEAELGALLARAQGGGDGACTQLAQVLRGAGLGELATPLEWLSGVDGARAGHLMFALTHPELVEA
jgi:hypothetical protein